MTDPFWITYGLLWFTVGVLAVTVLVCLRQLGEVYLLSAGLRGVAGDGLDEGRIGPNLDLKLASGKLTTLAQALPNGGVLLFAAEDCRVCERLVPQLLDESLPAPVVVVYDRVPPPLRRPMPASAVVVTESVAEKAPLRYKVRVTPFAFGLDQSLRVQSRGLVNAPQQISFHAARALAPADGVVLRHIEGDGQS